MTHLIRRCLRLAALLAASAGAATGWAQAPSGCVPLPPLGDVMRAPEQAKDHGLLWRFEKDGRAGWLYGTIHVGRPDWLVPGPQVRAALRASDTIALEVDLFDPAQQQAVVQPADPAATARILDAARQARIDAEIRRTCAPPMIKSQRPFLQVMTLALWDARRHGLFAEIGIDLVLAMVAKTGGKRLVGLETAGQQLAALQPASEGEERELVDRALALLGTERGDAVMRRLATIWADGDEAALADYRQWCECQDTEAERRLYERLNDQRNGGLADRIAALHAGGATVFAGIGALHLPGNGGVVALMRARGFDVRRVPFAGRAN